VTGRGRAGAGKRSAATAYYVTSVELRKIRGFDRLRVALADERSGVRMSSVAIGRNGTGKSTLLRCIALGLAGEEDLGALLAAPVGRLIREGAAEGSIEIEATPAQTGPPLHRRVSLRRGDRGEVASVQELGNAPPVQAFVCGYGLGRANMGSELGRDYRLFDSVATLFDYRRHIVDTELILRRLRDFLGTRRYGVVLNGLKAALGLGPRHRVALPRGGGVTVSGPGIGRTIPLEGWADGFRMTASWIVDLYGWAMRAGTVDDEGEVRGVVLIDEVEQHLHPAMQAELVPRLRKILPGVQFVATTHSPLVALGAGSDGVVPLHRRGSRVVTAVVPSLTAYSAEDVLTEDALFDTDPYPARTRTKMQRYQALAAKGKRTPADRRRLEQLGRELSPAVLPPVRDDPVVRKLDELHALLSPRTRGR
jgi:hypothetical protein